MTSCMEDIDLDTGERILGVHCVLEDGPEQELELSYIAPTGGTSSPVGEDVTITLFESGIPVGVFTRTSETKWRMDYSPEGGHTYRLEVKVPGEEPLTAETRFPSAIEIRTVISFNQGDITALLYHHVPTGIHQFRQHLRGTGAGFHHLVPMRNLETLDDLF